MLSEEAISWRFILDADECIVSALAGDKESHNWTFDAKIFRQLEKLGDLWQKEILTNEEFTGQKKKASGKVLNIANKNKTEVAVEFVIWMVIKHYRLFILF